ncbi:hypothetical protein F5Y06DRAFT_273383 [Hypoxylon sp. FL0890]|nr:hypothetical protein F5Y06DRAFT_273383 [Hypoxylon sp. FL0890]
MGVAETVFPVIVAGLVVTSIALSLRILVRTRFQGSMGYDDAVMCFGFIVYVLFSAFSFLSLDYGYGAWSRRSHDDPEAAAKFWTATQITYPPTSGIIKIAVALLLFRINVEKTIRRILILSIAVDFIVSTVFFLILVLQCRPLSLMWGVGQGSCIDFDTNVRTGLAFSVIDIVLNWMYSLLPIPMLWKVQIGLRLKIILFILFGLGLLSSVATILRFQYILKLVSNRGLDVESNERNNDLSVLLWSHVELFLAMFTSSLLNIRPLLRHGGDLVKSFFSQQKGFSQFEDSTELVSVTLKRSPSGSEREAVATEF